MLEPCRFTTAVAEVEWSRRVAEAEQRVRDAAARVERQQVALGIYITFGSLQQIDGAKRLLAELVEALQRDRIEVAQALVQQRRHLGDARSEQRC